VKVSTGEGTDMGRRMNAWEGAGCKIMRNCKWTLVKCCITHITGNEISQLILRGDKFVYAHGITLKNIVNLLK
jgi:hypothetical protein